MKKLVLTVAAVSALALGACGSDGSSNPPMLTDSGVGDAADAKPPEVNCNPVLQTGCGSDEKCDDLVFIEDDPATTDVNEFAGTIACVPNGTATEGMACTDGPVGETSYDTCAAGYDCLGDVCVQICDVTSCAEGNTCITNIVDHFNDATGICVGSCDPTSGVVADGLITYPECGASEGCLILPSGPTACFRTATEGGQNEEGTPFLNGCKAGFSPELKTSATLEETGTVCARFCSPENTYLDAMGVLVGAVEGTDAQCGTPALNLVGTRNGNNVAHQCRFLQNYTYRADAPEISASYGSCVPVKTANGGIYTPFTNNAPGETPDSFGDCSVFEWGALKVVLAPATTAEEYTAALFGHCLSHPDDVMNPASIVFDKCIGLLTGCISLEEENSMVMGSARTVLRQVWQRHLPPTKLEVSTQR